MHTFKKAQPPGRKSQLNKVVNEDGLCTMVTNVRQGRELHMVRKKSVSYRSECYWLWSG